VDSGLSFKMPDIIYFFNIYALQISFSIQFLPRDFIHSADCAVAKCLSVRPSVRLFDTRRYSIETAKHIIKLFSPILVFFNTKQCDNIPTGTRLTGPSNAREYEKSRFSANILL